MIGDRGSRRVERFCVRLDRRITDLRALLKTFGLCPIAAFFARKEAPACGGCGYR